MRKALTLIELIFSMVIIGIVFTVIPKLIISMNQSAQVTIKEEAMFNAVAMMGAIINLPWDNNNTVNNQILNVSNHNSYDCNASNTPQYYRKGGFIGGRNCSALTNGSFDFNASSIGKEDAEYNDIDDYDRNITETNGTCSSGLRPKLYDLNTTVSYIDDDSKQPITDNTKTTNTKMVHVVVKKDGKCITDLNYTSYNLGNTKINYRAW